MSDGNLVGYVMLATAAPFLAIGVALLCRSVRFARRGIRVVGTVIRYHRDPGGDGQYPEVEYTDAHGEQHRRTLDVSLGPPPGEMIQLIYDPSNPGWVVGATAGHLWGVPVGSAAVGFCIFGVGVAKLASWI